MKRMVVLGASLLLVAGLHGCKTTSSSEGGAEAAPAKSEKSAPSKSEKAAKPAPAAIPANSPLAKVKMGMPRNQVDDLLGSPTSERRFPSGKGFNPFYYGPDTYRTGAFYKGLGRVVFSGADKVVEIEYDPTEDGY
jgi:outer membrane protein assembly factor BamE (lipoprotein component of BamABCDE complex)